MIGLIAPFPSSTAPTGWLACDGSIFDSAAYPDLFAVLGSTTLPDYRNRVVVGGSTAGSTAGEALSYSFSTGISDSGNLNGRNVNKSGSTRSSDNVHSHRQSINGDQKYFGDWGASSDDFMHYGGNTDQHWDSGPLMGQQGQTNADGCSETAAGHGHRLNYRSRSDGPNHTHSVETQVQGSASHSHGGNVSVSNLSLPDTGSANLPRCRTVFYFICAEAA